MRAIRSKDTRPELNLRRALWKRGLRYRLQFGSEKIDVAFPSAKIAVFVDGCFWHGCPLHSHIPKSNSQYWVPKLKKNINRDKRTNIKLTSNGWTVLRFWEHELVKIESVVNVIRKEVNKKRADKG